MRKTRNRDINTEFAKRLNYLLLQKGLKSHHSRAGVRVNELAAAAGCTVQMASRYVNGEGVPDLDTLKRVADWLEVSVGWLVYGETSPTSSAHNTLNLLGLDKQIVEYILQRVIPLFTPNDSKEIITFIMDLIQDVAQMKADPKVMMIYIDRVTSSVKRFHNFAGAQHQDGKENKV